MTKTGEAGPMISQSLVVIEERRIIELEIGAVDFPMTEIQE
jgi:hypothetical protein